MRDEWLKLPGLFCRREFEQVIKPREGDEQGQDWFVEHAGNDDRNRELFAIYHRPHASDGET